MWLILLLSLCNLFCAASQKLTWIQEMNAVGDLITQLESDIKAFEHFDEDEKAEEIDKCKQARKELARYKCHPRNLLKARELAARISEQDERLLGQHYIIPPPTNTFSSYFLVSGVVSLMLLLGFAPVAQAVKPATYRFTSCSASGCVITQQELTQGIDAHISACNALAVENIKECSSTQFFPENSILLSQNMCQVDSVEQYYKCLATAKVKDANGNIITLAANEE